MPPGQTIPSNLSWAVAKKVCSQGDMERLACAYLNATEPVQFDAEKVAKDFGGGKADSFKRGIWVITKKIKENKGGASGGEGEHDPADSAVETPPTKTKAKPGRKRKAAVVNEGDGGDEDEAPPPKKRGGGKKAVAETAELTPEVKPEPDDDGENDFVI